MGRRWGKTVLGFALETAFAVHGGRCAWVVPEYKNGRPLWRMLRRALAEHAALGLIRISETERTIEFAPSVGGGFVAIYTGDDNCDAMRGEDFDLVVLDEAARISEVAVYDTILPTLADRNGKLVAISTPKGRNWFWREWLRGQDTAQHAVWSTKAPSADNPNPQIQRAARLAKERVSDRTYQQEWLAEFVEDAGGVFKGVRACLSGELETAPPHSQRQYSIGVDLAKVEDYTVAVVVDVLSSHVVAFERFHLASWPLQKARIADLANRWNNAIVWLDSTGVGAPIYDDLAQAGLRIHAYTFTNASKTALVDNAVLLVEQRKVTFPASLVVLLDELEAYEYARTPAGAVQMHAPGGSHDDCVIAFALACWPLKNASSQVSAWGNGWLDALTKPASEIGGANLLKRML